MGISQFSLIPSASSGPAANERLTHIHKLVIFAAALHVLIVAGCVSESQNGLSSPSPTRTPTSDNSVAPSVSKPVSTPTQPPATATSVPTRTPEAVSQESSKSSPVEASPTATLQPTYTPVRPKPVLATPIPEPTPTPVQVSHTPTPLPAAPRWEDLRFTQAFSGAKFQGDSGRPLDMLPWPGGGMAVLSRPGMITLLSDGKRHTLLNLVDVTQQNGAEDGLLSMALSPNFDEQPFIYVYYSVLDEGKTRLARFPVQDGRVIRDDELVILDVPQPTMSSHNGGSVRFGPDGMLYLGLGDGGGYDGFELAQELETLLGSIVRIDVRDISEEVPYRVPPDNPLIGVPGAMPEIFAWGFRNPWRMSFDPDTGTLWVGDVGENKLEEVNIVRSGANYGWGIFEGELCRHYTEDYCAEHASTTVAPAFTYERGGEFGGCAVIGGVVYRGTAMPWLDGTYLFGDFCANKIWALEGSAESGWQTHEIHTGARLLTSFAVDSAGEVYLLFHGNSPILKLVDSAGAHTRE